MESTELRPDCANCFGLCCVALRFHKSSEFAFDKQAGSPCTNLASDHRCTIHGDLRERGFSGCVAYSCQGAGQKVSQVTFGGRDWQTDRDTRRRMVVVFPVVRQLHQMLVYLTEALEIPAAKEIHPDVVALRAEIEALTFRSPDELLRLDVGAQRHRVWPLVDRTSELARHPVGRRRERYLHRTGADLRGADLRRQDLRWGAFIRADLTGADLRGADLLGADLRGADLSGADLRDCLFVDQSQLETARGNASTRISGRLTRPEYWV